MRLDVHLSMDGAAFDNGPGPLEVSRILRHLADQFDRGVVPYDDEPVRLKDVNGNRVGYAIVTENA